MWLVDPLNGLPFEDPPKAQNADFAFATKPGSTDGVGGRVDGGMVEDFGTAAWLMVRPRCRAVPRGSWVVPLSAGRSGRCRGGWWIRDAVEQSCPGVLPGPGSG